MDIRKRIYEFPDSHRKIKLHILLFVFADAAHATHPQQTRRFCPFCSVAYYQMCPQTRYGSNSAPTSELYSQKGQNSPIVCVDPSVMHIIYKNIVLVCNFIIAT